MLRKRFFPPEPEVDMSDIEEYQYPSPVEQLPYIDARDVQEVLKERLPYSAPGADGIPNGFLKALGKPFAEAIAALTEACWKVAYYPKRFH